MKPIHPTVVALQARMFAARLKPGDVFRHAGVASSTWWRWTQGGPPTTNKLDHLNKTIDRLIALRERQTEDDPHGASQKD